MEQEGEYKKEKQLGSAQQGKREWLTACLEHMERRVSKKRKLKKRRVDGYFSISVSGIDFVLRNA